MSEATERIVVGTCLKLEEGKNGWYTVNIGEPGKQYPTKAQTKLENLLNEARRIRDAGLVATWTIKDQPQVDRDTGEPVINPNSGKQYINHYLNNVVEGAQQAPAGQTQLPTPEPHHDPIHFADKDRAISRMACLRTAAMPWEGLALEAEQPDGGIDIALEVMKTAQRYESWIYRDIDAVPSSRAQATPEPEPEPPPSYADDPPPDDDIPF